MTMWLMRAGRSGEREEVALRHHVAVAGWDEVPDLTPCSTRARLEGVLRDTYPEQKPRTLHSWHGQLWAIRDTARVGDLVVLPLKTKPEVALGVVAGPYEYRMDIPGGPLHTRPVDWVAQVPRRAFDLDILLSFSAFMSVCRIERNDAEQRVRALMAMDREVARGRDGVAAEPGRRVDVADQSAALIRERVGQRFKGHALAELVGCLLAAEGYRPRVSPPGPDGGVDIVAGCGPLGFGAPRLVVQVKSQDTKLDVRPLRELAGVMARHGAEHGLLVCWGGFTAAVRAEAAADHFRLRLWDAGDLVAAIQEHYPALPHTIQAEIPLRQVWTLVAA